MSTSNQTWQVRLNVGPPQDISANSVSWEGGPLVFRDPYGKMIRAFGVGHWLECTPVETAAVTRLEQNW